jgi:hypothetical protein
MLRFVVISDIGSAHAYIFLNDQFANACYEPAHDAYLAFTLLIRYLSKVDH